MVLPGSLQRSIIHSRGQCALLRQKILLLCLKLVTKERINECSLRLPLMPLAKKPLLMLKDFSSLKYRVIITVK